jgi:predicted nucleotidyltransferase
MGTPREGLDRLRDAAASGALERVCERLGITMLVVFGSATTPDRVPRDLDVAVRLRDGAPADVVDVTNALIDLTGTTDIDVMDLGSAGVVARARALGGGSEPLYEAESGAVALAQMGALAYAMETAPMRRRDLELLAER